MISQHVQSSRRTTRSLAVFISLALLTLILAACTGAPSLATSIQAPAAAAEKPIAAPTQPPATMQIIPAAPAGNLTRSAEAGAVTVDITPLNLGDTAAATLDFAVAMNTHSVDLGVDLAKLAALKVGDNEIAAQTWQAPTGGGHHVEGTLRFPAKTADGKPLLADVPSFSVIIRNLAGVPERVFTWDLGQADAPVAASAVTGALPMGQGSMTSTMPMSGAMPMSGDMMGMMDMMKEMPPTEHQQMMATMMGMMQGMMGQMGGMPQGDQAQMMPQMMNMMSQMLEMMKGMPADAQSQMMPQMMRMMAQMMNMAQAPALHSGAGADMHGGAEMAGHGAAIPAAGAPDATATVGGQPLAFKLENGVKVFELTARPVRWNILDNVKVTAWTYNGTVPGPMIRVTEGDKVRIVLKNELPEATSIHWHGIPVPNAMDGVTPIPPGESFAYEFTSPPAGTFMYHSHIASDKQVMVGLYAPFIVDPQTPPADKPDVDVTWMLSEWRVGADGQTYPAMPMMGSEPNYFTINGKSFPQTAPIEVKKGQRVRVRLANVGQFTHPMHLHGMNFKIVAYDGAPLPPEQQVVRNTVPVNPGELVDIEFVADNVGTWMFHCHVLHHVTNDGVEPGGLVALVNVTDSSAE